MEKVHDFVEQDGKFVEATLTGMTQQTHDDLLHLANTGNFKIKHLLLEHLKQVNIIETPTDWSKEQCIDPEYHKSRGETHCNGSCQLNAPRSEDDINNL